jgi:hypothetical protein
LVCFGILCLAIGIVSYSSVLESSVLLYPIPLFLLFTSFRIPYLRRGLRPSPARSQCGCRKRLLIRAWSHDCALGSSRSFQRRLLPGCGYDRWVNATPRPWPSVHAYGPPPRPYSFAAPMVLLPHPSSSSTRYQYDSSSSARCRHGFSSSAG